MVALSSADAPGAGGSCSGVPGVIACAGPTSRRSPSFTPLVISTRSVCSSRSPSATVTFSALPRAGAQHPGRLRIGRVHRGQRHHQGTPRLLRDPPLREQAGHQPARGVGDRHENRHLPRDRVGGRADPLDATLERLARIAAHLELHRQTDLDRRQRLGRHRRLEPHAARIDDAVQLGAGTDDVAGVHGTGGDHAVERRANGEVGRAVWRRRRAATAHPRAGPARRSRRCAPCRAPARRARLP